MEGHSPGPPASDPRTSLSCRHSLSGSDTQKRSVDFRDALERKFAATSAWIFEEFSKQLDVLKHENRCLRQHIHKHGGALPAEMLSPRSPRPQNGVALGMLSPRAQSGVNSSSPTDWSTETTTPLTGGKLVYHLDDPQHAGGKLLTGGPGLYPPKPAKVEAPPILRKSQLEIPRVPVLQDDGLLAREATASSGQSMSSDGSIASSACMHHDSLIHQPAPTIVDERWSDLVHKLSMPKARVAVRKNHVMLAVWTTANRRFASNLGSCVKIKSQRHDSWLPAQKMCFFIVNPNSHKRTCWLVLCLLMTLYDVVMAPVITFFSIDEDRFHGDSTNVIEFVSWISCIFWTLDVVSNFLTGTYRKGILEMRPLSIAVAYAKTWLLFDLCLVISQWLEVMVHSSGSSLGIVLRALRLPRLLRLLRLDQFHGCISAAAHHFQSRREGVVACSAMLKIVFAITCVIHLLACGWYGVGRISSDGWAHEPSVASESVLHRYILSVQWAAAQVHGTKRPLAQTTFEHSFAAFSSWLGLLLFAFFVSNATFTVFQFNNVENWKMEAVRMRFCQSHCISQALSARIEHYLALHHRSHGISEEMKEDVGLLSALPPSIRLLVINAIRWPLLKRVPFHSLLEDFHAKSMRRICQETISVFVALEEETVFEKGDTGKSVFIVQFGKFLYNSFRPTLEDAGVVGWGSMLKYLSSEVRDVLSDEPTDEPQDTLGFGSVLSEAVLWTKWEHTGDLKAMCDSATLVLDPEVFVRICREREDVLSCAACYASKFVTQLNESIEPTDQFRLDMNAALMSDRAEAEVDRHLIFLSHYKAEAGTEATLMQEALTRMISEDTASPAFRFRDPIFLDSANLEDLGKLREHVKKSLSLVLLLTPGVLQRPWCLVEIATSLSEGVRIVPVEVQRPGMSFKYPDERFYKDLKSGKFLSNSDVQVLRGEGIGLDEVERSVRHVFKQIALPFSPHKSAVIRQAELSDILSRSEPVPQRMAQRKVSRSSSVFSVNLSKAVSDVFSMKYRASRG